MKKIIKIVFLVSMVSTCAACAKKLPPPDFTNKFQTNQTRSLKKAKNYELCKHCIYYTNF